MNKLNLIHFLMEVMEGPISKIEIRRANNGTGWMLQVTRPNRGYLLFLYGSGLIGMDTKSKPQP